MTLCLGACREQAQPAGVVATVNGEPIYLHTLQTLLDTRTAALGIPPRPSVDAMRKNYAQALGVLITHALIRQELAQMEISPSKSDFASSLEDINRDFEGDSLDGFLADSSIRKDDWQQLMRDHLALETFRGQVLQSGIKISLDEIKSYYLSHESDFHIPDTVNVCFITAENKDELESMCANLSPDSLMANPMAQCMDMLADEIPLPWRKQAASLKPFTCARTEEQDGEWRTVVMTSKTKERTPALSEVYALIENILLEQRRNDIFDKWLENRIAHAKIEVAPELNECFALIGNDSGGGDEAWSFILSGPKPAQNAVND